MPTSSKDEEMLTMNKALMDLIMDGRGPDGSGWVVFFFFVGRCLRSRWNSRSTSYEEYRLGTHITWYYFPRNLQKDPLFPDP